MADISNLTGLLPDAPLDLDNYPGVKAHTFRLPEEGRYTLRAPDTFGPEAFGVARSGALTAQIDPTIVGGPHDGFLIKYIKVSAKSFDRKGQRASQMGDYFRACGMTGTVPSDPQTLANNIEATAGRVYTADVGWRAYNRATGLTVEGMKNFPKRDDGTYQSWVEDPNDLDENGNPKRVRANLQVIRFISA